MKPPRHRVGDIVLRLLAASLGGYAMASLAATALALALPGCCGWSRAEGVLAGSLLGFLCYLGAALWAFSARSAVVAALSTTAILAWLLLAT